MEPKDLGKTSTGIQPNVAALLTYVLGWLTGLIFFLIEKDNKYVRFHALQSLITFGGLTLVGLFLAFIPGIGIMLLPVLYLFELVLWIILMIKAYQGEKFKLPVAGDIAEQKA